MTAPVLLTVSGDIAADLDDQVARGRRPRADYVEMARAFDADLIDYSTALAETGRVGRLIGRLGGNNALLAWECFRRRSRYSVIFTDGEQVGLPLAALLWFTRHRPKHLMIVHILSVPKKALLVRALGLRHRIDRAIVYATAQERYLVDELKFPPERVVLSPFMVDTGFFAPNSVTNEGLPLLCSAGLEFRDYPTLVEAVRDLDVRVVLAAASPWSKRDDSSEGIDIPANVEVDRLGFEQLRTLYAEADLVVVPVVETDFQAGITTILEAMAMAKPLICTRTTGQTDTISDGVTGVYVPPGDVEALRSAILRLLDSPDERRRLGAAARSWTVEHADIEVYASRLADIVADALADEP